MPTTRRKSYGSSLTRVSPRSSTRKNAKSTAGVRRSKRLNKDLPDDEDGDAQRNLDFDNNESHEDYEPNAPIVPTHRYFTRFKNSMAKFSGTVMASLALAKLKAHIHSPNSDTAKRIFRRIRSFSIASLVLKGKLTTDDVNRMVANGGLGENAANVNSNNVEDDDESEIDLPEEPAADNVLDVDILSDRHTSGRLHNILSNVKLCFRKKHETIDNEEEEIQENIDGSSLIEWACMNMKTCTHKVQELIVAVKDYSQRSTLSSFNKVKVYSKSWRNHEQFVFYIVSILVVILAVIVLAALVPVTRNIFPFTTLSNPTRDADLDAKDVPGGYGNVVLSLTKKIRKLESDQQEMFLKFQGNMEELTTKYDTNLLQMKNNIGSILDENEKHDDLNIGSYLTKEDIEIFVSNLLKGSEEEGVEARIQDTFNEKDVTAAMSLFEDKLKIIEETIVEHISLYEESRNSSVDSMNSLKASFEETFLLFKESSGGKFISKIDLETAVENLKKDHEENFTKAILSIQSLSEQLSMELSVEDIIAMKNDVSLMDTRLVELVAGGLKSKNEAEIIALEVARIGNLFSGVEDMQLKLSELEKYVTDLYKESDRIKSDTLGEFEKRFNQLKVELATERESLNPVNSNKQLLQDTINDAIHEWASVGLHHHETNDVKNKWISELRIKSLISLALEKHTADKVGKIDYASRKQGGSIIHSLTSESFVDHEQTSSWDNIMEFLNLRILNVPPEVVIDPSFNVGDCWPMNGSEGSVSIRLSKSITPHTIGLDHISPQVSLDIGSAPNRFEVYGRKESKDGDEVFLGGPYSYSIQATQLQLFQLKNTLDQEFNIITVKFLSNHGNEDYTCIYRLRVYEEDKSTLNNIFA